MAQQLVEQTGLPRIRAANDRHSNATAKHLALVGGAQQLVHKDDAGFQSGKKLVASFRRNIFVRKINMRLEMRQCLQHFVA